jgi:hypothetical protein
MHIPSELNHTGSLINNCHSICREQRSKAQSVLRSLGSLCLQEKKSLLRFEANNQAHFIAKRELKFTNTTANGKTQKPKKKCGLTVKNAAKQSKNRFIPVFWGLKTLFVYFGKNYSLTG